MPQEKQNLSPGVISAPHPGHLGVAGTAVGASSAAPTFFPQFQQKAVSGRISAPQEHFVAAGATSGAVTAASTLLPHFQQKAVPGRISAPQEHLRAAGADSGAV